MATENQAHVSPAAPAAKRTPMARGYKLLIFAASLPACIAGLLVVLRLCGLICPFSIPSGAMDPAVSRGDHILMEGFTFLTRRPRPGDIVIFWSRDIAGLPGDQSYIKRVAGVGGDRVRISDGKLFINDNAVTLSNADGEITYRVLPYTGGMKENEEVTVPAGHYFLLGDNTLNSLDSRNFGCVPGRNIRGTVAFCYWPPSRAGRVK
jgi:signal peptidase I